MFTQGYSSLKRTMIGSLSAVVMGSALLFAAAGPAAAASAPLTIQDWVDQVQVQVNDNLRLPSSLRKSNKEKAIAKVRLALDAEGKVRDVKLVSPSGIKAADAEALRVARALDDLPVLPEGLRGRPNMVEVQVYFGVAHSETQVASHEEQIQELASQAAVANEAMYAEDSKPARLPNS